MSRAAAKAPATEQAPAPWYARGLKFACTQCGRCCGGAPGYVWITPDEASAIAVHLKLSDEEFQAHHVRKLRIRWSLKEKRNGDCEFLVERPDGRKQCGIYAVRPVQCRTWPFWKSNLEAPEGWEYAGEGCPGINHGPTHALPVIQEALERNGSLPL